MQFDASLVAASVAARIGGNDAALRAAYDAMPSAFPQHSQPPGEPDVDALTAFRKRLLYRSKQRGWLEVDLLLGSWAEATLRSMSEAELRAYEHILNLETVDLFNYLQEMRPLPPQIREDATLLGIMEGIIAYTRANPVASPAQYDRVKKSMSN